jgi:hypothetical protein
MFECSGAGFPRWLFFKEEEMKERLMKVFYVLLGIVAVIILVIVQANAFYGLIDHASKNAILYPLFICISLFAVFLEALILLGLVKLVGWVITGYSNLSDIYACLHEYIDKERGKK